MARIATIQGITSGRPRRDSFATGLVDDKVFQIAGHHAAATLGTCDYFDLDTWSWAVGSSTGTSRRGLNGHNCHDGSDAIWVAGGYSGSTVYETTEKYSVSGDSWSSYGNFPIVASVQQKRRSGVCLYDPTTGEPFYFGGKQTTSGAASTMVFKGGAGGGWSKDGDMSVQREDFAGVYWDGDFYLFGGRNSGTRTNTAEKYTPGGTSTALANMPVDLRSHSAYVCDGFIYIACGTINASGGGSARRTVFQYDPRNDSYEDPGWQMRDNNTNGAATSDGHEAFYLPGRFGSGTGSNSKELYACYHTEFGNHDFGDTTRSDIPSY